MLSVESITNSSGKISYASVCYSLVHPFRTSLFGGVILSYSYPELLSLLNETPFSLFALFALFVFLCLISDCLLQSFSRSPSSFRTRPANLPVVALRYSVLNSLISESYSFVFECLPFIFPVVALRYSGPTRQSSARIPSSFRAQLVNLLSFPQRTPFLISKQKAPLTPLIEQISRLA